MNLTEYYIRIDKVPLTVQTVNSNSNFASFVINTVTSQDGTLINWTSNQNYDQTVHCDVIMDTLYIELTSANNSLVDINDSEWSFALKINERIH